MIKTAFELVEEFGCIPKDWVAVSQVKEIYMQLPPDDVLRFIYNVPRGTLGEVK